MMSGLLLALCVMLCTASVSCAAGKPAPAGTPSAAATLEATGTPAAPAGTPETPTRTKEENGKNIRLGAYVWYGFAHMGWSVYTERYMKDFVDKLEPAWGYGYSEVEDMEYQIDLAVEGGLSFFAFEYWWNEVPYLNEKLGLENFLKAKNSAKLDFCLLIANHDKNLVTYANWKTVCEKFIYYMSQENALKVDGKPVITFFLTDQLIQDLGGVEKAKECFDYLRSEMKNRGQPEPLIVGCDLSAGNPPDAFLDTDSFSVENFKKRIGRVEATSMDAMCGSLTYRRYVRRSYSNESELELPFQELLDLHEKSWNLFSDYTDMRFAPGLANGWDDRLKWEVFSPVSYYYTKDKTGDKFYNHVINAYEWMRRNPKNALGNIAFIYAWDETDEGAFFIPTKSEGTDMLDAMRRAVDDINKKAE
jgi:hypothetical protein